MMRVLTTFIILLLIVQRTYAGYCQCNCCTSVDCAPQRIGSQYLFFCSASTCTRDKCAEWYFRECPPRDGRGSVEAICNGTERLSPLFVVFGISSIILMLKNKF
jgi:hypothetical protein